MMRSQCRECLSASMIASESWRLLRSDLASSRKLDFVRWSVFSYTQAAASRALHLPQGERPSHLVRFFLQKVHASLVEYLRDLGDSLENDSGVVDFMMGHKSWNVVQRHWS